MSTSAGWAVGAIAVVVVAVAIGLMWVAHEVLERDCEPSDLDREHEDARREP